MCLEELLNRARIECRVLGLDDNKERPYTKTYAYCKQRREYRLSQMTEAEREAWRQHRNAMQRKYQSTPEAKERLSVKNAIRYQERKARQ